MDRSAKWVKDQLKVLAAGAYPLNPDEQSDLVEAMAIAVSQMPVAMQEGFLRDYRDHSTEVDAIKEIEICLDALDDEDLPKVMKLIEKDAEERAQARAEPNELLSLPMGDSGEH